jgi:hypothetical protein
MDNIAAVRHLFSTVHHKLHDEICHLQKVLEGINHLSDDPAEQWAHGLYTKLIERRCKMLDRLVAEAVE